jgi:Fe-S oxidoreductase
VCELPEGEVCCGFGGSTSADHPQVARAIAARKLDNVAQTGANVLVTDNPGCLLHLRGAADARGMPIRLAHMAEILAERLS